MTAKKRPSGWEDIADVLTLEGVKAIEERKARGESVVLTFTQDGENVDYKVVRLTPYKCWVKKVRLYDPDEVGVQDKDNSGKTA